MSKEIEAAVRNCLDHYLYKDAIFIAKRTWIEVDDEESLFLLATCYYRAEKKYEARSLLETKKLTSPKSKFLLAKCYVDLNNFSKAEFVLLEDANDKRSLADKIQKIYGPEASYVFQLLGQIFLKTDRKENAKRAFKASLILNPLLWSSFDELNCAKMYLKPEDVFKIDTYRKYNHFDNDKDYSYVRSSGPDKKQTDRDLIKAEDIKVPASDKNDGRLSVLTLKSNEKDRSHLKNLIEHENDKPLASNSEPATELSDYSDDLALKMENTIIRSSLNLKSDEAFFPEELSKNELVKVVTIGIRNDDNDENDEQSTVLPKIDLKRRSVITVKTNSTLRKSSTPVGSINSNSNVDLSIEKLLTLFINVAKLFHYSNVYDYQKAVEIFNNLPARHKRCATILCRIGKLFAEIQEYESAIKYFRLALNSEPYIVDGMEIYSVVLWHVQETSELLHLAQRLMNFNPSNWVTSCVNANLSSLQNETERTVEILVELIKSKPAVAYPYLLLGFEYINNEDFINGEKNFRIALSMEPENYKCWYGLGEMNLLKRNYGVCKYYFKKALTLNRRSAILLCRLAVVQIHLKQYKNCMVNLNEALAINSKIVICQFYICYAYYMMGHYEEAIKNLKNLIDLRPNETAAYELLATVYKKIGKLDMSLKYEKLSDYVKKKK